VAEVQIIPIHAISAMHKLEEEDSVGVSVMKRAAEEAEPALVINTVVRALAD
jgi:hypothetical protein